MRIRFAGIVAAVLLPGCHAKHEATSGKEFFRKFRAAALASDADTLWNMMAREVRERLVGFAKFRIESVEARERFDESGDVPALPTREPRALATHLLRDSLARRHRAFEQADYIDSSTQNLPMIGEVTTVVFRHPEADRDMLLLIEVDGYLKAWQTGTLFGGLGYDEPTPAMSQVE